jgi:site-specific DNA-methyltransferase (adenine-specific)
MRPYYEDAAVTIYHGDAIEVLGQIGDSSAHLAATDPPYFRVIDAEWDDQWGPNQNKFLLWLGDVIGELNRVLHDRGTLAMFCSPDLSAGVEVEVRRRMSVLNHIVWRKSGPGRLGMMNKESMRRFFPTSERIIVAEKARNPDGDLFRFRDHVNHAVARDVYASIREDLVALRDAAHLTNREIDAALGKNGMASHYFGASQWHLPTQEAWLIIQHMMRDAGVNAPAWDYFRQEFDARRQEFDARRQEFDARRQEFDARRREFDARRREFDIELLSDVWTFKTVPPSKRLAKHPTQKPLELMDHLIGTMSRLDDVVVDPFMGTGTTLRAAKDIGRKAIGIEKDERYCEAAALRMSDEDSLWGEAS